MGLNSVVDHILHQGRRLADTVLNRDSKGDSMKCDCMKTGVAKLVLLFSVRLCIWLSQLCCHGPRSIN